ncbi:MAG: DUF1553 domain-containing protein [Planctomycetes bacterium]|nr:DUF1553 domain-containing protein [Planctomycetota bacterium]
MTSRLEGRTGAPPRRSPSLRSRAQAAGLACCLPLLLTRAAAREPSAGWRDHWAYAPPVRPSAPPVRDAAWPRNAVDRFILARLEREGLRPSPEADAPALARRLHLDLIGLPPAPAEVQSFAEDAEDAEDASPDAWERLAGRLLASPHFGERMAMHWLDLVRYADTVGYHGDQEHAISPYRDYVIRAFDEDMPFDRFTIEQIAGDLLPEPTLEQRVATGYNRLLQTSHEGGVQQKEYLAKYAADRVRNASAVWLGSTMGCAECHDHKYDPFTQRDFYSLAAFFADVDDLQGFKGGDTSPTKREPEIEVPQAPGRGPGRRTMVTVSVPPRTVRVLPRGDWLDESGEAVEPAAPRAFPQIEQAGRATRLDLARWLVSPRNPLAARAFVNRLWSLFFGKGISSRLDDLGTRGEPPVHPELLDWLAVELVESGWDVKRLARLLVTSRTYRQASTETEDSRRRDPENRLLARGSRMRLPAELIRDHALVVSGLLVRTLGGPSVRPYQPEGYYQHLNFPKRTYEADGGEGQHRRGVYIHWQRAYLHPMLKAFDAPSREECTAERPSSNTPLAALVLLNDPTFVEAARAFAARILREGGASPDDRIRWAWREVLSREPEAREAAVLRRLLEDHARECREEGSRAGEILEVGLATAHRDIDPVELAAWSAVARAIFNLDETITRS